MRTTVWLTVCALTLALAACSPKPPAAPSPPPAPPASEPAPPLPAASAPAPESPQAAPVAPETTAATPPAPPAQAAATAPAQAVQQPAPVRFSPSDYAAQERRVAALINNAESRDTSGETQYVAQQGREQRERCTTRPCIAQSYAAEEAKLRKWEGSGDIR
jgi:hypothetical protein